MRSFNKNDNIIILQKFGQVTYHINIFNSDFYKIFSLND